VLKALFSKKRSNEKGGLKNADNDKKTSYQENGYYILRGLFNRDKIKRLQKAVNAVHDSKGEVFLRHDETEKTNEEFPKGLENDKRSGLLRFHTLTEGIGGELADAFNDLFCQKTMFNALNQFFDADKYTLHQTILFFTSPLTNLHPDLVSLDTTPSGSSFTCWMALDQIDDTNGGVFIAPNPVGKRDEEMINSSKDMGDYVKKYKDDLYAKKQDLTIPVLSPGDVVLFAPTTPHGSLNPKHNSRRRGFQILVRITKVSQWGQYKDTSTRHDTEKEEVKLTSYFNTLKKSGSADY